MERLIRVIDVLPSAEKAAASHVKHRIVRAVKNAFRTKRLQRQPMHVGIQYGRTVEVQALVVGKMRERFPRMSHRIATAKVGD
jgi:hypothetical protein